MLNVLFMFIRANETRNQAQ